MKVVNSKSSSTSKRINLETNNNSQRKKTNSNSLKKKIKILIIIIIIPLILSMIISLGILIYSIDEMEPPNITLYREEKDSVVPKTLTKEEIKIAKYNTVQIKKYFITFI